MNCREDTNYLDIPTIFAVTFSVAGVVLDLLIQFTGKDFFFHSFADRLVYLFHEPLSFFLLGSIIGVVFIAAYHILACALNFFRGGRAYSPRFRLSLTFFVIVILVGAFLSNNIIIQGGYKINWPGNIVTLLSAVIVSVIVYRYHGCFTTGRKRFSRVCHLCVFAIALLYSIMLRMYWTGTNGVVPRTDEGKHPRTSQQPLSARAGSEIENVIIFLVDALRADHLSLYGYPRSTSPNLDRWANQAGSIVFENTYTSKTKTSPAVASLFTGLYPTSHGVFYTSQWLADDLVTMAEFLQDRGFKTASIVANGNISREFNFHQGFGFFKSDFPPTPQPDADMLVGEAVEWLDHLGADERFFVYLHLVDPHYPYDPPQEYKSLFLSDEWSHEYRDRHISVGTTYIGHILEKVAIEGHETDIDYYVSMYDSEIRYMDHAFDSLLSYLDESGLAERTLIVFTSDHGESLTEHNYYFSHGAFAYQPTARIPLILHHPSLGRMKRIDGLVNIVDIMPSILDLLGMDHQTLKDSSIEGTSLLPLIEEIDEGPGCTYVLGGDWLILRAINDGKWKLIYNPVGLSRAGLFDLFNTFYPRFKVEWLRRGPGFRDSLLEYQLYDLENDPYETNNLVTDFPLEVARLRQELDSKYSFQRIDTHSQDVDLESVDESTLENLRGLGYIQ